MDNDIDNTSVNVDVLIETITLNFKNYGNASVPYEDGLARMCMIILCDLCGGY